MRSEEISLVRLKNMLIGQVEMVRFFDRIATSNAWHHAYGLVGQPQMGKKTLARQLAAGLLKKPEVSLEAHPDFHFLGREIDEKKEKMRSDITIEQIRTLKQRVQKKSWLGGYQVILIDEAECLTIEASNALLKMLEEPPEKSIFFLLSSDEAALLPTIRSRMQTLFFSLVSTTEIAEGLKKMGCAEKKAILLAEQAWGRPGRAIDFFLHPEEQNKDEMLRADWHTLSESSLNQSFPLIETLLEKNTAEVEEYVAQLLVTGIREARRSLLQAVGETKWALYFKNQIEYLIWAEKMLRTTAVQPRLLLENVVAHCR